MESAAVSSIPASFDRSLSRRGLRRHKNHTMPASARTVSAPPARTKFKMLAEYLPVAGS